MASESEDVPILASQNSTNSTTPLIGRTARKGPQILCALVACLSPLSMGFVLGYSSPTLTDLQQEGLLNKQQASWFGSLVTIGAIAGGPLASPLVGKLGRKTTLMLICLPYVIGWFLIIFANHYLYLYAGRLITGISMGATSLAAPLYIAEIAMKEFRGFLGAAFQLFVVIGIELVYVLGIPFNFRWLAVSCACFPSIQVILLAFMPETPRYLVSVGHRGEAMNALRWLRGPEFPVEDECAEIESNLDSQPTQTASFRDLLQPACLKPLTISLVLMFFQQFSGINAVIFYSQSIFKGAGFENNPELASTIVGGVMVVATFVSCCLMDLAGRRILLLVAGVIMTVSAATFGVYYYFVDVKGANGLSWLSLTSCIVFVVSFSLGWGPIPWLVMGEIFPVRAKGLASGIANTFNWTCAFIVTKEFHDLTLAITEYGTFWLFAGICLLSNIYVMIFVPETKGKTLEEIEQIFIIVN